jgi:hypothetical protein
MLLGKNPDGTWSLPGTQYTTTKNNCPHEWSKSLVMVPIDFLAYTNPPPPTYRYQCDLCQTEIKTRINLFDKEIKCKHEYQVEPQLGPKYHAEYCKKCNKQKVNFL